MRVESGIKAVIFISRERAEIHQERKWKRSSEIHEARKRYRKRRDPSREKAEEKVQISIMR